MASKDKIESDYTAILNNIVSELSYGNGIFKDTSNIFDAGDLLKENPKFLGI